MDYVEVFRANTQLIVEPMSGVLGPEDRVRIEMIDPPDVVDFEITCGETDLTERLTVLRGHL